MSILKKLTKITIDLTTAPASLMADFVTLGGVLTEQDQTYTIKKLEKIKKDAQDIYHLLEE
jgi:hypothetical protein